MEKTGALKKTEWTAVLTVYLLDLWEENVDGLRGVRKNTHIYKEMGEKLGVSGAEVKNKVDNLTKKYRKEQVVVGPSGGAPSTWEHYERVNKILATSKAINYKRVMVESTGDFDSLPHLPEERLWHVSCMKAYVEFEISEGAYEISCPDAQCPEQGAMILPEIAILTTTNLMKKHHRYRLNREIELDKTRTWCPRAGCETVCLIGTTSIQSGDGNPSASTSAAAAATTTPTANVAATLSPSLVGVGVGIGTGTGTDGNIIPTPVQCVVQCPSCKDEFCSACKKTWHPNITCEEHSRRLAADGQDDIGIPFDNDLIKCCPMCAVPIEKDEGCAQMMCKRCKHVFCWYCLASLDDDFLLRHYDKGPCKNKLGHSRASVVWHRAQVIGIFAGFGILLLVASPLLLLAAPCIICCKCRSCSGSKIDEGDGDMDEATALQSLN